MTKGKRKRMECRRREGKEVRREGGKEGRVGEGRRGGGEGRKGREREERRGGELNLQSCVTSAHQYLTVVLFEECVYMNVFCVKCNLEKKKREREMPHSLTHSLTHSLQTS